MKKGFWGAHVLGKCPLFSKENRERTKQEKEKAKETLIMKEEGRKISELRKSIDFFAGRRV